LCYGNINKQQNAAGSKVTILLEENVPSSILLWVGSLHECWKRMHIGAIISACLYACIFQLKKMAAQNLYLASPPAPSIPVPPTWSTGHPWKAHSTSVP
jgi:hypothetical protein